MRGARPGLALSAREVAALSRVSGWKSLAIGAGSWAAILGLAAAAERSGSWAARALAIPIIAALQNHQQILLHEGAHFLLHPKRRWNDLVGNLLFAVPSFNLVSHYRRFHLAHHRHAGDPARDPEASFYAEQGYRYRRSPPRRLLRMLALDVCGFHAAQFFVSYHLYLLRETRAGRMPLPRGSELAAILAWVVALASLLIAGLGRQVALYWLLPQFTVLFLLLKLQGYGEHTGLPGPTELERTWSHSHGWLARFFVYPLRSGLHLEHHLFPTVPWYGLGEIRRALGGLQALRTDGYFLGRKTVLRSVLLERGKGL